MCPAANGSFKSQRDLIFYAQMLNEGKDKLNVLDESGNNQLHHAIIKSDLDLIVNLIEIGADIDLPNHAGHLPTHLSLNSANSVQILHILASNGACINEFNKHGVSPLILAIENKQDELVDLLLDLGADPVLVSKGTAHGDVDLTPLSLCLLLENESILSKIVNKINSKNNSKMSIEEIVLFNDDFLSLKVLIDKNFIDFSASLNENFKLIHYASSFNSVKCFKTISNLSKPLINDANFAKIKINPIHVAAQKGNYEILELILEETQSAVSNQSSFGLEPIHYACQLDNFKVIKLLIENGADPNAKSKIGQTPLHIAALNNRYENIRLLISYGADPNVKSLDGGFTPLHVACNCKSYESAALLVKRSANINTQSDNGYSPLHLACLRNAFKICYLLCQQPGINLMLLTQEGFTALHIACFIKSHSIADCLMKFDCRLLGLLTLDKNRETALHIAVKTRNILLIKTLMEYDPKMNILDAKRGYNPLHLSIHQKSFDITSILCANLSNTDDIDLRTACGLTPSLMSVQFASSNFIKILIDNNANVGLTTSDGKNVLCLAILSRNSQYIESLISYLSKPQLKFLISQEDKQGLLPIHFVALKGDVDIFKVISGLYKGSLKNLKIPLIHLCASKNNSQLLKYLISCRFDLQKKDSNGFTAAHFAAYHGSYDCLKIIIENCPKLVESTSIHYLTPMHICQFHERIKCADLLLDNANSDILNAESCKKLTPLHYACYFKHDKMIKFLLENGSNANLMSKSNQLPLEIAILRNICHETIILLVKYTRKNEYSYILDKIESRSNLKVELDIYNLPLVNENQSVVVDQETLDNLSISLDKSHDESILKVNINKILKGLEISNKAHDKEVVSFTDKVDPYLVDYLPSNSAQHSSTHIASPDIYPLKRKISREYLLSNGSQHHSIGSDKPKLSPIYEKTDNAMPLVDQLLEMLNEQGATETFQNIISLREKGIVATHESGLLRFIFLPCEVTSKIKVHIKMVELSVLSLASAKNYLNDWVSSISQYMPIILNFMGNAEFPNYFHCTLPLYMSIMSPQWRIKPLISRNDDDIWVYPRAENIHLLNLPSKMYLVKNVNESLSTRYFGFLSKITAKYIAFEVAPIGSTFKNQIIDGLDKEELTFSAFQSHSPQGHKLSASITVFRGGSNALVEHLRFYYLQIFSHMIDHHELCIENRIIYCSPLVCCTFDNELQAQPLQDLHEAFSENTTNFTFQITYTVEFDNLITINDVHFDSDSQLKVHVLNGMQISNSKKPLIWNDVTKDIEIVSDVNNDIFDRNGMVFKSSFKGPHLVIVSMNNFDNADGISSDKLFAIANTFYYCMPIPRQICSIAIFQKLQTTDDEQNVDNPDCENIDLLLAFYPLYQNDYFEAQASIMGYQKIYCSSNLLVNAKLNVSMALKKTVMRQTELIRKLEFSPDSTSSQSQLIKIRYSLPRREDKSKEEDDDDGNNLLALCMTEHLPSICAGYDDGSYDRVLLNETIT